MKYRLVHVMLLLVLCTVAAGSIGLVKYQLQSNSLQLLELDNALAAAVDGNWMVNNIIAKVLKSHKQEINKALRGLKTIRKDLETQGQLTSELAAHYKKVIEQLQDQIARLDKQIKQADHLKTNKEVYKESLRCSVKVIADFGVNGKGSGSGTIVDVANGCTYVLTAYHVVQSQIILTWEQDENGRNIPVYVTVDPSIEIKSYSVDDGSVTYIGAEILFFDANRDLALLKVSHWESLHIAPLLPIDQVESLKVLDSAYAIGSPLGVSTRISFGEITATLHAVPGYIETSCNIIWGNSGGGLFKAQYLIGIPTCGRIVGSQMVESLGMCTSIQEIYDFLFENDYVIAN